MQALEDVKAIAATAKKAAEDRQAFTVKLADVTMGMNAFQGFDNATFTLLSNAIGNANAQATANNYVTANATLDTAAGQLQKALKSWVDTANGMLAKSTANASAAGFLKPELDAAKTQVAAANTALGARRWSEGVMAGVAAVRALAATERMAPRRASYETARTATQAKIAQVKANAAVADRGRGLDALVVEANTSASRDVMQFEAGEAQLRDINTRCDMILAAAADTEAYKQAEAARRRRAGGARQARGRGARHGGARSGAQAARAGRQGSGRRRDRGRPGARLGGGVERGGAGTRRPGGGEGPGRRCRQRRRRRSRGGEPGRRGGDEDGIAEAAGRPGRGGRGAVRG